MASETSRRDIAWNSDTTYALGLSRMLTQVLGIWPLQCQDLFSKIRLFVVAILEISMGINLIREILADCVVVDEMINFLALVGCSAIAFLKVTLLRINQTRMELVIKSAVEDWSRVDSTKERMIMRKHAYTGRFVFIFQMSSAIATVVPLVLASLPFLAILPAAGHDRELENTTLIQIYNYSNISLSYSSAVQRNLPMGTGCFVSDISTFFYSLIYVMQTIQLITTCAGNVGTDVYFFQITMHVCGQFELLRMNFEALGEDPNDRKCHEELSRLVQRHNHLMKLSNNFEDTFSIIILAQLSVNALHMSLLVFITVFYFCSILYTAAPKTFDLVANFSTTKASTVYVEGIQIILSAKAGNGVAVAGALMAFYVLSLQLFLYSYAGDYLTSQIEKIRYASYCCHWYDLPPKIVGNLIFVMSRSNRAFHLTAGKVYHMNIDNFKNIFKAMGSYFSMLRLMFDA